MPAADKSLALLNEFYSTMDQTQMKLETKNHGFAYLEHLSGLAKIPFSEWVNGVYRYRLTDLKPEVFQGFLQEHIDKKVNVCIYFNESQNNMFCFNLDSFTESSREIKTIALLLEKNLKRLRIQPLILKSGRGYHFWCRLSSPVENGKLQSFMKAMVDVAVFEAIVQHTNLNRLQCICYPRFHSHDVSIRLFGSNHIGSGRFLCVVTQIGDSDDLLNEENSWRCFETYLKECTLSAKEFDSACVHAAKLASLVNEHTS